MNPALVFSRMAGCFLTGVLLGPGVDVLRPLRRRLPRLSQLLIAGLFFAAWLFSGFALCRSDLRLGYYLSMMAGFGVWERCFGTAVAGFAGGLWHIAAKVLKFFPKIFRLFKKYPFARREK